MFMCFSLVQHKTIDSVLARGEKLDSLVEKSSDLSAASQVNAHKFVMLCYVFFSFLLSLVHRYLKNIYAQLLCVCIVFSCLHCARVI